MGTNPFSRKSNIQKIAEVFGPKKTKVKKDKKSKKRMMANKGGGADTGTMGEIKSKLGVLTDKMKKIKIPGRLTDEDKKKIKEMMKNNPKDTTTGEGANIMRLKGEDYTIKDGKVLKMAKGGSVKKKKKFPDMSGDGKITMKDVLMARGVIPKNKKDKKKVI